MPKRKKGGENNACLNDYSYWVRVWETYINYVKLQFSGYTKYTANQPWHIHLRYLLISSAGLFYVISIISLFHLRRFWVFIILMLAIQLLHNLAASKEYVNTLLAIPFFLLMASGIIAQWGAQKDEAPKDEDEEPKDEYKIPQQNLFIAGKKKSTHFIINLFTTQCCWTWRKTTKPTRIIYFSQR